MNKNKYSDDYLLNYNGWQLDFSEKGLETYEKRKNVKNTVVSVIGNKNKGKSFVLAKLNKIEIPDN